MQFKKKFGIFHFPIYISGVLLAFAFCAQALLAEPESQAPPADPIVDSFPAQKANSASADAALGKEMDRIDQEIMLKLIELARFNINFCREANHHQWWRAWLYPVAREAGTAASFAYTLTDLSQSARGLSRPGRISKISIRHALQSNLCGNLISGSASSFELAQNAWVMMAAKRQGYSPSSSVAFVRAIVSQTDKLLQRRDELASKIEDKKESDLHELEKSLLLQVRLQLLYQFRKWSCTSREVAWRENVFYALDAAQNFVGAASPILSLKGFHHPARKGPSAICSLVSNSMATLNPLVSELAGYSIRRYQKHKLAKDFPMVRPATEKETTVADVKDFANQKELEDWRLAKALLLASRSERMDKALDRDIASINRLRTVAQQKAVTGPLIGLATVARSTLATVAAYAYSSDKVISTRLAFSGRISQSCGQLYALIDTPATQVRGIIKSRKLEKKGEAPEQVFQDRMKRLDELEAQIKEARY
ncbi:MAG: hypothetical protein K2X27_08110 [Candidatus Obscuribacterales bacterium]|nr:hypothetical protein [Candidatus Obscuribacterales bacterium]